MLGYSYVILYLFHCAIFYSLQQRVTFKIKLEFFIFTRGKQITSRMKKSLLE